MADKTVRVSEETWRKLRARKRREESFDAVIRRELEDEDPLAGFGAWSDTTTDEGSHSARELHTALDVESNTLDYHLDALVAAGLVENQKQTEPSSDGLYSDYRATSLGEGTLEHGVHELMREEWDLVDVYGD